ncbi:MAG: hypothetical protein JSR90_04360 [Proteobacteria bacterium]|nr:hypothetical protein [Pseudomonadota bacterium]
MALTPKNDFIFAQSIDKLAVIGNPNSATFAFETARPCAPVIDIFPLTSAGIDQDMQSDKVIAGNAMALVGAPLTRQHVFRVARRWIPGRLTEGAQLRSATRYRFRITALPDDLAAKRGYSKPAVIHGQFTTGSRSGAVVVGDLNVMRAGDPHHFGLTVGAYRDSDGQLLGQLKDTFTTSDDPVNFGNSSGSFRAPFGQQALSLAQCSDKVQLYAMGWGPNRSALSTAPFRSSDFEDAPSNWPATPDHGEDDNGPWATAVGFTDLPDWTLPDIDPTSFDGAMKNAAALASTPARQVTSTQAISLASGNYGVNYQADLSIGIVVLPPTDPAAIDRTLTTFPHGKFPDPSILHTPATKP